MSTWKQLKRRFKRWYRAVLQQQRDIYTVTHSVASARQERRALNKSQKKMQTHKYTAPTKNVWQRRYNPKIITRK